MARPSPSPIAMLPRRYPRTPPIIIPPIVHLANKYLPFFFFFFFIESLVEKSADQIYNNREDYTYQNHGCDREIKLYIFFLNADVTRQFTNPAQPPTSEIKDRPCNKQNDTCDNKIFPNQLIHDQYPGSIYSDSRAFSTPFLNGISLKV